MFLHDPCSIVLPYPFLFCRKILPLSANLSSNVYERQLAYLRVSTQLIGEIDIWKYQI
jgi:hypothetical protein